MDKLNKDLKETNQSVGKLRDNLDKVDVKTNQLSVSAKDVALTYKKEFQEVMNYLTLQMSKIGAIITELNTHVGQAIDKNIDAGEKLAQKMEKSAEKNLSSFKIQAIEASTVMEGYINKLGNISEKSFDIQSKIFETQLEKNKKLVAATVEDINEKYKGNDIGRFNLKAHKENVEGHIGELKVGSKI